MHILLHDYVGHPFQAQLSRALATRGHRLTHIYNGSNPTSPKGNLVRLDSDPESLTFEMIELPRPIAKTSFFDRWRLERLYGQLLAARISFLKPDIVISANTPLDALQQLNRACQKLGTPWVYWLQDLIGLASQRILREKIPVVGGLIGTYYVRLESYLLGRSRLVIGITEEFSAEVKRAGVPEGRYKTIPNWAPLSEIETRPKVNRWSVEQGLTEKFVFLYSGTLGFKHNPALFIALAKVLLEDPKARLIVNSEGPAADWLRVQAASEGLENICVNPFQPYEMMSEVLATADVLLSILEPEAGIFSVPSKVLAYHCAGRAMLLAIPAENLAARIVIAERTGVVVDPRDAESFAAAGLQLKEQSAICAEMAKRARAYAERNFDIEMIANRFEMLFERCLSGNRGYLESIESETKPSAA